MGVESLSFMMLTLISWDHDMTYFFRTFIIMIGTCLLQGNYTCLSILSNLLFTSINWPIKNKKLKEKKKKKKKRQVPSLLSHQTACSRFQPESS
jgi:hypothetical protein